VDPDVQCGRMIDRGRVIRHELLDEQPPNVAAHSLRDLVRINRLFGGHQALRKTLARVVGPSEAFTMLDVGAASGDMGRVVRREYPYALVTSLDYRTHHLAGAEPPRVAADAFRLPFRSRTFDIVHCSLFLHHFEDDAVVQLLRAFGEIAKRHVIVSDLERHPLAYYFLPATKWFFGWHAITLHDGPISVAAAFRSGELRSLAVRAGLRAIDIRAHRPAFRLCLVASPPDDIFASWPFQRL
jgi:2-polyprenyl-3-methyl-5-hydroxy-6-metoxy-1,4-benzoquinol methylase